MGNISWRSSQNTSKNRSEVQGETNEKVIDETIDSAMTDILNLALSCTRTQRTHNPYGTYTLNASATMADLGKALTDFIDYSMSTTNIYAYRGYFNESSKVDYARSDIQVAIF